MSVPVCLMTNVGAGTAQPPPVPLYPGGSLWSYFHVPEKSGFPCARAIAGRARANATNNSTTRLISPPRRGREPVRYTGSRPPVDNSVSAAGHWHQRPAPNDLRRICIFLRMVLLRAPTENLGHVQIPIRVGRHLVHGPGISGPGAELPERELQVSQEVVFDHSLGNRVVGPDVLVRAHDHGVRRDVRPLVEELAVLVKHLNAPVRSIGNKDVVVSAAHGDSVRGVELTRGRALAPPLQQNLSVLVELHDALIAVAVGDEEALVRQPVDECRATKMLGVVVVAFFIH